MHTGAIKLRLDNTCNHVGELLLTFPKPTNTDLVGDEMKKRQMATKLTHRQFPSRYVRTYIKIILRTPVIIGDSSSASYGVF